MLFSNINIVLVNISHPGNIGAVARAMKNMCLERLCLVQPKYFPHAEATARAAGADGVLAAAHVCETLDDAIKDCCLVVGTSARRRTIAWPELNAHDCARLVGVESERHRVALVFGREHSGLTNEELDCCHSLVHIPCNTRFSSLNIAAAVQVIAYELMKTAQVMVPGDTELRNGNDAQRHPDSPVDIGNPVRLTSAEEMAGFYTHLQQTLITCGFLDPENPRQGMRRLRRLFNRARPDTMEINILRGILTAIQQQNGRKP